MRLLGSGIRRRREISRAGQGRRRIGDERGSDQFDDERVDRDETSRNNWKGVAQSSVRTSEYARRVELGELESEPSRAELSRGREKKKKNRPNTTERQEGKKQQTMHTQANEWLREIIGGDSIKFYAIIIASEQFQGLEFGHV